jgi:2-polyprenyl-3-methyl-5-hydroxy-6-metoxy-1,4-benzoquinol methylase
MKTRSRRTLADCYAPDVDFNVERGLTHMARSDYAIRGGMEGRERLRILARVLQPTTRALLDRVALRTGMTCLDVGCGGGDVTREIARLVRPTGRVLGIDIDETKIELARCEAAESKLAGIEFRVAGLGGSEWREEFDVVYTRFVLTHLSDPAAALAWIRARLRPGGLAVVEDIDFKGHFCHPDSTAFRRYVELYTELVRRRGADADIGPRLPGLFLDSGFGSVQMNVVQPAGFDGEVKLIAAITVQNIADALLAEHLASRDEIDVIVDELDALASDGRTVMSVSRIVQAWGSREASAVRTRIR